MDAPLTKQQKKIIAVAILALLAISVMIYTTVSADYRLKAAQKKAAETTQPAP